MNNTAFLTLSSDISDISNISQILPLRRKQQKRFYKEHPFVIVNSDHNFGSYIQALMREIEGYHLTFQQSRYNNIKKIRTNDFIIFGDSESFDFRIEIDVDSVEILDNRRYKVFDLVRDFQQILKRLDKYARSNYRKGQNYLFPKRRKSSKLPKALSILDIPGLQPRRYSQRNKVYYRDEEEYDENIIIDINVTDEDREFTHAPRKKKYGKTRSSYWAHPYPYDTDDFDEKVTVHENWVKIGYNQFDIYKYPGSKEEFITVNGKRLFIREDRFGHRHLA